MSPGGSSPLARGLRDGHPRAVLGSGIIPARAGFTRDSPSRSLPSGDHPRSRGVYRPVSAMMASRPGSSPLARGLPLSACRSLSSPRIIPARAGFTRFCRLPPSGGRDHPRSRGVYDATRQEIVRALGSSPLARGLHRPHPRASPGHGIIPARAGFTAASSAAKRPGWDHPRSRGVYAEALTGAPGRRGIIPARAGFTSERKTKMNTDRDHPRSRGVYRA